MKFPTDRKTVGLLKQYVHHFVKHPSQPAQRFVLLAEGRSGSTLLVNLLNASREIQCDGEILNQSRVPFPSLFIDMMAARCSKQIYGFKLLDYQLEDLQKVYQPKNFLLNLHRNGYKFIYLIRRNRLYHVLSQLNAIHKNKFHSYRGDSYIKFQPIEVDINHLISLMDMTEATTQRYASFMAHIPHLKLIYEDNLQFSKSHQETADQVFKFLDIPSTPVESSLMKLMPSRLSDMVSNHVEVTQAIQKTQYSCFLD